MMRLTNWLSRKEINRLNFELNELQTQNKQLRKNLREVKETAKHFDWSISNANQQVRKLFDIVGLDEYGNPKLQG